MGYDEADRGFRTPIELARFKHPPEVIEKALFEMAACGGSANKAAQSLRDQGLEISAHTIREWKRGPFRNRYHEIVSTHQRDLDSIIAAAQTENIVTMLDGEREALKQTMAGIANANGVEASNILRNIAQAKRYAVQNHSEITGRPRQERQSQSLQTIAAALARMGLVETQEPVDAEVVEG